MTAVGFLLLIFGIAISVLFGDDSDDRVNLADSIGVLFALTGSATLVIGVALWLWDVMP